MDRRTLLSLLTGAGVAVAGCSNQSPETPTGTPTEPPTRAPTDTPAETPTEEPTDAPTGTPTEEPTVEPTDTPTEEPTTEPTDTPTREERTRRAIREAREALDDIVDAYTALSGPNATLLTVDVTVPFSTDRLEDPLARAKDAIERAERSATGGQVETVGRLRRTRIWLRDVGTAQAAASDAFQVHVRLRDAIYAGEQSAATTAAEELDPLVRSARDLLNAAVDATEASDVTVVPDLSEELYEGKNAQLRAAVRTFELLVDQGESTAAAVATFVTGTDAYAAARRREARNAFREAEDDLNRASILLSAPDLSGSRVGERTADLACACGVLSGAAADLASSASAWLDGNRRRRTRKLEAAKAGLTGCGNVLESIPVVERVRDLE